VPLCAFLSFRLGLADGVSVVAATWADALLALGWKVVTVAGAGPVDRTVAGLAIDAPEPPTSDELARALADADLVVVENLLSIPLNLPASRVVAEVLAGRPAILHHHDPPWQRERFAGIAELPPDDAAWRHVTINELTRTQMAERGIDAVTIYNGFDTRPPTGDREGTRARLGMTPDRRLAAHPVRAIPRKNVPGAIEVASAVGAVYWLLGVAEEGYDDELARVLAAASCPVLHSPGHARPDIYAAADLVLFPSTWEGFGNPPIEAAVHRRPVVVGDYPVAREIRALGFEWFDPTDLDPLEEFLAHPDPDLLEHNRRVAVEHFSLERMQRRLAGVIDGFDRGRAGWAS
jgi:glycosyltransferase involved in cell wall biosynthesis